MQAPLTLADILAKVAGMDPVSLFPIPGSVSLPFSTVPLHVFEPRYRKMIHDSVAARRRVGVAHTQKVIAEHRPAPGASHADILSSNHSTYLAHSVFSAGFAEIVEVFPDGRLAVQIEMDRRFEIVEEQQSVPYKIVLCRPFEDAEVNGAETLRERLDKVLLDLVEGKSNEVKKYLLSAGWREQSLTEYSFKIFSLVQFDPDTLQKILELQSPADRIEFLVKAFAK